jgi:mono/diheme cytochrome c family protein
MPKSTHLKFRNGSGGLYLALACGSAALISACVGVVDSGPDGLDRSSQAGASVVLPGGGSPSEAGGTVGGLGNFGSGGSGNNGGAVGSAAGSDNSFGSGTSGGTVGSGGNLGNPTGNGLSCEVNRVLSVCQGCHGVMPALKPLATRSDLLGQSVEQPGQRLIDVALSRMRDTANPMPPKPQAAISTSDIAIVAAWAASGTPVQSCTTSQGGGAGGVSGGFGGRNGSGGMTTAGGSSGSTAVVCTSNMTWRSGNGPNMRPGDACPSCHGFTFAGTVYPTAHEPAHCNGIPTSAGVKVIITGADGNSVTLTPGTVGNFSSNANVRTPFTVKVTSPKGTRSRLTPQTSGNCNMCHTQNGANGAPGRIMAP